MRHSPRSPADFLAMMERLVPRFEPHPIVHEFIDIIQSGRAAPAVPRFLHRALARAAVSILPPLVRERLQLGPELDLGIADRITLKMVGGVAERFSAEDAPPRQACERLGLPSDFLYRSQPTQQRLLREAGLDAPATGSVRRRYPRGAATSDLAGA